MPAAACRAGPGSLRRREHADGTDFYANLRNPDILTFVLDLVPDATRK